MMIVNDPYFFAKKIVFILLLSIISLTISNVYCEEYLIQLAQDVTDQFHKKNRNRDYLYDYLMLDYNCQIEQIITKTEIGLSDWFLLRTSSSKVSELQALKRMNRIMYHSENHHMRIKDRADINDPLYSEQWYHHKVGAYEAWQYYNQNEEVILAIIDTGIDYHHPDLGHSFWINSLEDINGNGQLDTGDENNVDEDGNGYVDDVIGWDFTDAPRFPDEGDYLDPDNDPMDEYGEGHGTQVAGIIAAGVDNELGIAGLLPGLKVMIIRAGTANGYLEEDDVARAVIYAIDNGASIINMSFGDVVVSKFLKDVIQFAYSQGIIMVAAAGNDGSNELHYPSGFPETIGVGATNENDQLAGFSNWGNTIDLVAPGVNILSTSIGGGYSWVNGTSFSTPMVAAGAALLLANHSELNPEQVRNLLKTGSFDLGEDGWDEYYGSGRLDILKLSQLEYESSLYIKSPLSGSSTDKDSIPIIITVQDPDLKYFDLQYGIGDDPDFWNDLVTNMPYQVIDDTITVLNTKNFADTLFILRLKSESLTGIVNEYRSLLYIDKTAPIVSNIKTTEMCDGNAYAVLIEFDTDDIASGEIYYRYKYTQDPFQVKILDYQVRHHSCKIDADDIYGDIEYYIKVRNLSGIEYIADNNHQYHDFSLKGTIIPPLYFNKVKWKLPAGYLLPVVTDFDDNQHYEIILSEYDLNNNFGPVKIYELAGDSLMLKYQSPFKAIPRATGDSDNDGKDELLIGWGTGSFLIESDQADNFPSIEIWSDTSDFWASQLADLDQDGLGEIIGYIDNEYHVLESNGDNSYIDVFTFINPSEGENVLGVPKTVIADLDEDTFLEFVFGDYDGDIIIYENTADNSFTPRYQLRLPFKDATSYLTAGKFMNNHYSLIAGTHSFSDEMYEHESTEQYWHFVHIVASVDNNYQVVQEINIYGYSDIKNYDTGLNSGSIFPENIDYLFLAPYPNLYIFKENEGILSASWIYSGARTNAILTYDMDKNGAVEFYFNNGDNLVGYEIGQATRPVPPGKFKANPLDSVAVYLSWTLVENAERYIICRSKDEKLLPAEYDSTSSLDYLDSDVVLDSVYYYAMKTVDHNFQNPRSELSEIQSAKPNFPPRIDSLVTMNPYQFIIYFNETMDENSISAGNFYLKPLNIHANSATAYKNGYNTLLTFLVSLERDIQYQLEIKNVMDKDNTLLDRRDQIIDFRYSGGTDQFDKPYIEEWILGHHRSLFITFNVPMDTSTTLSIINYKLEPQGAIISVELISADKKKYKLILSYDSYAGATGIITYLVCDNLKSDEGVLFTEGNRIALVKTPTSLKEMYLYPQPVKSENRWVMFANVPPATEITIYNIHGQRVTKIIENDQNGGVMWDLKNSNGNMVSSGIYLYRAKWEKETKLGKIAIVR
jgi:subtilisin family serine protease